MVALFLNFDLPSITHCVFDKVLGRSQLRVVAINI